MTTCAMGRGEAVISRLTTISQMLLDRRGEQEGGDRKLIIGGS